MHKIDLWDSKKPRDAATRPGHDRKGISDMTNSTSHINALLTEVGVNMGDHGQDVTKAVIVNPEMTVQELVDKFLTKRTWMSLEEPRRETPADDRYLTIRLAVEEVA